MRKQCLERVVGRDDEADGVDEKLGSNVEEDEEEVESTETEDDVNLGYSGLLLKLVEVLISAELLIELGDVILGAIL